MKVEQNKLENLTQTALFVGLRLAFVAILLIASFYILSPFLMIILWGIVISVGVYPLFEKLTKLLNGRKKLASTIMVVIAFTVLVIPFTLLIINFAEGMESLSNSVDMDTFHLPAPSETVKDWPVIGSEVYSLWESSYVNISFLLEKVKPYIVEAVPTLISTATSAVGVVFQFIFSVIIAGVLLVFADEGKKVAEMVFKTILGKNGDDFMELSKSTINGVVQGVVGTAIIQTAFLGLGFYLVGLPGASIFTLLVLVFAITQVPVMLLGIPIIIYIFKTDTVTIAIIFSIWTLIGSALDNVLKPILMGRGATIPMIVIFIGSLGGMIAMGIIGLFLGAVILAITYKMVIALGKAQINE